MREKLSFEVRFGDLEPIAQDVERRTSVILLISTVKVSLHPVAPRGKTQLTTFPERIVRRTGSRSSAELIPCNDTSIR